MLAKHYRLKIATWTVVREPGQPSPHRLSDPEAVATLAQDLVSAHDDDKEHFWVLLLNSQNHLAQAQEVVIDPTNLVQNTISALRIIESVINEVTMIANQLEQIRVLIQNTTNYPEGIWDREALPRLLRLGRIIEQEQALSYTLGNVDSLCRQRYPGYRPITDWSREYDSWTRTTLDTLRGTLNAVRLHGEDFPGEQARIDSLTALSDTAVGRMQVVQTGNMIAAEQVQQLVKLRQLVMAQVNAQNIYMASQANREAQRAATQSEWVRNGNATRLASTPRPPRSPGFRGRRAHPCAGALSSWRSPSSRASPAAGANPVGRSPPVAGPVLRVTPVPQRLLSSRGREADAALGEGPDLLPRAGPRGPAELPDRRGGRRHGAHPGRPTR
jgi:P-type conjugative transfer protein TrbJ